jgi:hypothetical protein
MAQAKSEGTLKEAIPSTNKNGLTVAELDRYLKNNPTITFPTENWESLIKATSNILQAPSGWDYIINTMSGVRKQCYDLIFDDRSPEYQKYTQLIAIAKVDMVVLAAIWCAGNTPVPKALGEWTPIFGLAWIQRAKLLVTSQQVGWDSNIFWMNTYEREIAPHLSGGVVISQTGEVKLPIRARTIKDVELRIQDDQIEIGITGDSKYFHWKELKAFWDKKSKKPNSNARMLMDCNINLDGCLDVGGVLNVEFGEKSTPTKQINKLAKALDTLVFIEDNRTPEQDGESTKRWFRKSDKFPEPRWYPKFIMPMNTDNERMAMVKDIVENGMTAQEIAQKQKADEYHAKGWDAYDNGIKPYSEKLEKIQNQYKEIPD